VPNPLSNYGIKLTGRGHRFSHHRDSPSCPGQTCRPSRGPAAYAESLGGARLPTPSERMNTTARSHLLWRCRWARAIRHAAIAAGLLQALACGDATTSPSKPPSLTGTWVGIAGDYTFAVVLNDSAGVLSGNATLTTRHGPIDLAVEGTFVAPDAAFTMSLAPLQPFTFTGSLAHRDEMDGQLDGSGFTALKIVLNRT